MEDKILVPESAATERSRREYLARIHRAQDYIEENLGGVLLLETIAQAANFSPFHFHRLYRALTGETLYQFILRVRLERAASTLYHKPHEAVTSIDRFQLPTGRRPDDSERFNRQA